MKEMNFMETKTTKTLSFTGHRPQSLPFGYNEDDPRCLKLKSILKGEIIKLIEGKGVTKMISGMAIGIDMFCAEIVLELKKQYPQISLECAIPCENQASKWKEPARNRYFDILEKSDIMTMLQKKYTYNCMQKRNEYMVNKSDFLIAVWNGTGSGTGNTVKYAKTCGKEILIINPNEL